MFDKLEEVEKRYQELEGLMSDPNMLGQQKEVSKLAKERSELEEKLEERLRLLILPKDPNDSRNVILEIRAGTGGEEAALFAAELFRMYSRYAERQGWKTDILTLSETGIGGV